MTGPHADPTLPAATPEAVSAPKAPWHPPTLEEVDYSATEATGAGGIYDFTVYSGSTGP
jgi:hypothetical protein